MSTEKWLTPKELARKCDVTLEIVFFFRDEPDPDGLDIRSFGYLEV
jgi:hypothetical protein